MDGLSSFASATAVVSLAVQLADSIKKLYDFCESVHEAPEEVRNITADLKLLSAVLSEITLNAEQESSEGTLRIVLNQCTVKVGALIALINEIEPGFASNSCRVRKWSAFKAVLKDKKLKKLHVVLEGLKTTLILALQSK